MGHPSIWGLLDCLRDCNRALMYWWYLTLSLRMVAPYLQISTNVKIFCFLNLKSFASFVSIREPTQLFPPISQKFILKLTKKETCLKTYFIKFIEQIYICIFVIVPNQGNNSSKTYGIFFLLRFRLTYWPKKQKTCPNIGSDKCPQIDTHTHKQLTKFVFFFFSTNELWQLVEICSFIHLVVFSPYVPDIFLCR